MKRARLASMTIEQLVERFAQLAVAQDDALLNDEIAKFNRLYDLLKAIESELNARPGDQRRALLPLYIHPNAQVRLRAALATLAVTPEDARKVLQAISDRNEYPQAADARGIMRSLDEGRYVPR